jgi:hypothetical protein
MSNKTKHPQWCELNYERKKDFESWLLEVTNPLTGIRPRNNIQRIARKYNLWRYQDLADVFKQGDMMYCPHNSSRPTQLKYQEIAYNKYINFNYQDKKSKKNFVDKLCDEITKKHDDMIQQKIEFKEDYSINNIVNDLSKILNSIQQMPDNEISKNGYLKIAQPLHKLIQTLK